VKDFVRRIHRKRRVQAQGIHLEKLVYLSKEEFKFLKQKRVEFLKKWGQFGEEEPKVGLGGKKEAIRGCIKEDLKGRIRNHTPCYEATNIHATRDSLIWSWRRVKEYYQDLEEELDSKMKQMKRLIRN
jgi:hypothetical protein